MAALYSKVHDVVGVDAPRRIQGLFRFGYADFPAPRRVGRWPHGLSNYEQDIECTGWRPPGDPAFPQCFDRDRYHCASVVNAFRKLLPSELTEAQYGVLKSTYPDRRTGIDQPDGKCVSSRTADDDIDSQEACGKRVCAVCAPINRMPRIKIVAITAKGRRMRDKTVDSLRPLRKRFLQDAPDVDWDAILPSLTALRIYLDQNR